MLLEQIRQTCRLHHLSYRTEEVYLLWIKRFILFHKKHHPKEMDEREIREYLIFLADKVKVSPSTQNQAFSALLFLYKTVLKMDVGEIRIIRRPKRSVKIPVVLTQDEVRKVLNHLHGRELLMDKIMYGAGLRLMECMRLIVKDVDFGYKQILVRDGKDLKDLKTMLPESLISNLKNQFELQDLSIAEF